MIQLPLNVSLTKYSLLSLPDGNAYNGQRPNSWKLQASQNGEIWQNIDSRSGINLENSEFEVITNRTFSFYRLSMTQNNGWSQYNGCPAFCIFEIYLYGSIGLVTIQPTSSPTLAPTTSSPTLAPTPHPAIAPSQVHFTGKPTSKQHHHRTHRPSRKPTSNHHTSTSHSPSRKPTSIY